MSTEMTAFRLGEHLPNYTAADLQKTVAAYDPAIHEAPITIGHPRDNKPAWGWVRSLSAVGDTLKAAWDITVPEFGEWLENKAFKKRSISLYPPKHPDHPLGKDSDIYYLKHVAFLGAVPPKVKGMPDDFSESPEEGLVTVDFAQPRVPKGRSDGGQFASLDGAASHLLQSINKVRRTPENPTGDPNFKPKTEIAGGTVPNAKHVEIQSVGKFTPVEPDILAQGGMVSEGEIEINAFTKHTEAEDRAEGLADQYFLGVSKDTAKKLKDDPELLKKVIAIHSDNVTKGGANKFLDVPGTDWKLNSDSESAELLSLWTQKEYDNFAEFGDYADNLNTDLWRSLRDYLIETADLETADRVIPTYKIDSLLEMALRPPPESVSTYSEKPMALTEQKLEAREQAIALRERQATLKEQELQFSEAIDGAIKEGRVLPVEKPAHLKRLKMLAAIPADSVVDFAEGKSDYSPTGEYIAELKARPVIVNFQEISGETPPENTTEPNKIAAGIKAEKKAALEFGEEIDEAEALHRFVKKEKK